MPFDVYVPRLDDPGSASRASRLGVPYASGIVGVPEGDQLLLHCRGRRDFSHTWADQLHLATCEYMHGKPESVRVPASLMQHVAAYDHRDGSATLDSSWYVRSLLRAWLGSRRRHLSEEVFTTAYPEHQPVRTILHCVRGGGRIPPGVVEYARRNGYTELIGEPTAAPPVSPTASPRAPEEQVRVLSAEQTERFLFGLSGSNPNVEHVEVRASDGRHTHYRLRFANGMVGAWRYLDTSRPQEMRRISSLRRTRR